MESLKASSLSYFANLISEISVNNDLELDLHKEKLKDAFLSKDDFMTVLSSTDVLSVFDNYFSREAAQQGLLYSLLEKPLSDLIDSFVKFLKIQQNKIEQNFNETILVQTTPVTSCLVATILSTSLEASVSCYLILKKTYDLVSEPASSDSAVFSKINFYLDNLSNHFDLMTKAHLRALKQLNFVKSEDSISLKLYLDQLFNEIECIKRLEFGYCERWDIFISKVNHLMKAIHSLDALTKTVIKEYSATISKNNLSICKKKLDIGLYKNPFFDYLGKKQYSKEMISSAWNKIYMYCRKTNITASELITDESKLISPLIDQELVDKLSEIDKNVEMGFHLKEEKSNNYMILKKSKQIILSVFIILLTNGCGLKTPPKSQKPDLEPSIPYKVADPSGDIKNTRGEENGPKK